MSPRRLVAWGLLGDHAPVDNVLAHTRRCWCCVPLGGSAGWSRRRWEGRGSGRTENDGERFRCHVRALKRGPVELAGAGSSQGLSWRERRVGMSYVWGGRWWGSPCAHPTDPSPALLGGNPTTDPVLCAQLPAGTSNHAGGHCFFHFAATNVDMPGQVSPGASPRDSRPLLPAWPPCLGQPSPPAHARSRLSLEGLCLAGHQHLVHERRWG